MIPLKYMCLTKKSDDIPYVLVNQVPIEDPTNGNETFTLRWITILTQGEQLWRERLPSGGNMLWSTRCDPSQSGDARVEDWALGRHNPRLLEIHSVTKILTWNHQLPWIWSWVLKGLRPQESPLIVVRGSSLLIPHTPWHSKFISGVWFQKKKNQKNSLDSTTPSTQSAKLVRLLEHKYWGEETCSVGEGKKELSWLFLGVAQHHQRLV